MIIRADHVAGGAFVALGLLVFAISGDLPFGSLSGPGAGMMPKLMAGLMMLFAVIVIATGRDSPPIARIDWSDWIHAALLLLITVIAVASYRTLGFLVTMSLLVFALLVVVERRHVLRAAAYSVALTIFAYWLFGIALKAPLERGLLWF
jgi:Tripartite tricarboxylate transporter TctB family